MSDESLTSQEGLSVPSDDDVVVIETATSTTIERSRSPAISRTPAPNEAQPDSNPTPPTTSSSSLQAPAPTFHVTAPKFSTLSSPMDLTYAPPPLSPRRVPAEPVKLQIESKNLQPPESAMHPNGTIWLGQSGSISSSASSSVQSLVESGITHQRPALVMDSSQADFDAALDAAVEAAYNDGLEPFDYYDDELTAARPEPLQKSNGPKRKPADLYDDSGVLQDNTNEQDLEGFDFGLQKKNAPPRQSDSSGYSGLTYHSSVSSSRATGSSSLTTVAEGPDTTYLASGKVLGGLPRLSEENTRADSPNGSRPGSRGQLGKSNAGSVRNRRLSGQNAKQLKIETQPITKPTPSYSKNDPYIIQEETSSALRSASLSQPEIHSHDATIPISNGPPQLPPIPTSAGSRPLMSPSDTAVTISPATPGLPPSINEESSPGGQKVPNSRPTFLRKNKSSMSLKARTLSVSSPDGSDGSVATPLSTTSLSRKITNTTHPSLPTPPLLPTPTYLLTPTQPADGSHAGPHIFKSDIHSPHSPGFPNSLIPTGPAPLEACPQSVNLRPFWLLRCVFQTIANPAGGYISNRLFATPAVWNTKNVKLKAVDEKINACDSLTTALQRLSSVDSYDAAAVLDEMSSLESVLDNVQAALTKKLGNDVGVYGTTAFLKDAPPETGGPPSSNGSTSAGAENPHTSGGTSGTRTASKSYFSSLRKLRGKTSAPTLMNGSAILPSSKEGNGAAPKLSSVPMTGMMHVRFTKRDVAALVDVSGPNAAYMVAVARLCDAVQVVGKHLFTVLF
jgi:hypothetical protein